MNDIEVGEYVRTQTGRIGKVISTDKDYWLETTLDRGYLHPISEFKKHSKNLIDLIEDGDIVEIRTGLYSSFKYFVEHEDNLLLLEEQVKQFWNIETILTNEQFEANCYKVGGKTNG